MAVALSGPVASFSVVLGVLAAAALVDYLFLPVLAEQAQRVHARLSSWKKEGGPGRSWEVRTRPSGERRYP